MHWGQHFLVDAEIARRQISYANLSSTDVVLEIGPGHGVLTKHIAPQVRKVITIEIDACFVRTLANMTNVKSITADVLNVDLDAIPFNKVISNLPYQISSPSAEFRAWCIDVPTRVCPTSCSAPRYLGIFPTFRHGAVSC